MIFLFKGEVCGDKCLGYSSSAACQCGDNRDNEPFTERDGFYCCVPKNVTCIQRGDDVECSKGTKLRFNEFCKDQSQCAESSENYGTVINSNCSQSDIQHCPSSKYDSSKLCSSDVEDIEEYCYEGQACPKALSGLDYQQCFDL